MKITSIRTLNKAQCRYDLHVGDRHCYFANDILVHNTDGQNIMVTYKDGKVGAARNKSTIVDPMSIDDLKNKFQGRGDIYDAFALGMEDLENALEKLPQPTLAKFFKNGLRFLNIEIIYPKTKNVVVYGPKAYLQLHGMIEFDEAGNHKKYYADAGAQIQGIIQKANSHIQKNFEIIPPKTLKIGKDQDFTTHRKYFLDKVDKLRKQFKLKDEDEVVMYHQAWWERYIDLKLPGLSEELKTKLVARWAFEDKSNRILRKDFESQSEFETVRDIDKIDHKRIMKENIGHFEEIFLELGARVLKNVESFLSTIPAEDYIRDIKKQIKSLKGEISSKEDLDKMATLLKKIKNIGGMENIVPSEGIVFYYKGEPYKLTGLFAPINALLGITRYSR